MTRILIFIVMMISAQSLLADEKLTGKVIGTTQCYDYNKGMISTSVNTCEMAFDGNADTFLATYERSYTWAGLDLGKPYVITRVGWMPRDDYNGPKRVVLGVFEGANREDFMDALPLYVITEQGVRKQLSHAAVNCSKGFRYVRYVGPNDARCNIAELEFYGHEGEGDESQLYRLTNLPTVSIHTLNGELPYDKEHQISAQITIIGDSGNKVLLSEPGTIRERGNYSRNFPKKPYRIKFDSKQHVLDAPAKAKKWTLINNYGDKTLMRNMLAFEISRQLGMPYTPYSKAVDVLLNGEYKGCYQLCDQVEVNKKRVAIDELTPQDNSAPALTGGYLLEVDAYAYDEEVMFYSSNNNPVAIKSPDGDSITWVQRKYIESAFNKMEQQWQRYLDLNTFLRHFLTGELSGNTDTYWSVFMYKQRENDTIYTGPVWDFDLAFENDNRTYPINNLNDYLYRTKGSYTGNMRSFVDKIVVSNTNAKKRMLEIWTEARQDKLTEEYLVAYLDSLEEMLQESQRLNFLRWPIMNQYVHQNPVLWGSYKAEVDNARRFLKKRITWMDNKLGYDAMADIHDVELANEWAIDTDRPYEVYSVGGQLLGHDMTGLPQGVYILRQGMKTIKVRR